MANDTTRPRRPRKRALAIVAFVVLLAAALAMVHRYRRAEKVAPSHVLPHMNTP
jgi:hypothetical protein